MAGGGEGDPKHRNLGEACTRAREQKAGGGGNYRELALAHHPGPQRVGPLCSPAWPPAGAAAPFRMLLDLIQARGLTGSAPLLRDLVFVL